MILLKNIENTYYQTIHKIELNQVGHGTKIYRWTCISGDLDQTALLGAV